MVRRRDNGEGAIIKRADGRWEARLAVGWENGRRKRRSFYGATRREVVEKLAHARRKLAENAPIPSERLTVGELVERWLEDVQRPTAEPSTYARERSVADHHVLPALGRRPIAKLTQPEVQAWVARMASEYAPATVRLHHHVLHNALETAVQWRLIAYNPADRIKLPKLVRRKVPVLDQEPSRRFLQAIQGDPLEAVYVVALTTGMRIGEVLGLRWEDVDLEAGALNVMWKLLHLGKELIEGTPKSEAGKRRIELHALVVEALTAHRARQAELRLLVGPAWPRPDLVFTTDHGKPLRANTITSYWLPKALARAGLGKMTFHQLRHSLATLMLSRGEDIVVVQRLLGHSSPTITWGMYRHLLPGEQRAAVDRLGALLFGNQDDQSERQPGRKSRRAVVNLVVNESAGGEDSASGRGKWPQEGSKPDSVLDGHLSRARGARPAAWRRLPRTLASASSVIGHASGCSGEDYPFHSGRAGFSLCGSNCRLPDPGLRQAPCSALSGLSSAATPRRPSFFLRPPELYQSPVGR